MGVVEEGVANFRDFQADMRTFTTQFTTREDERKKTDARRAKLHYAWLGLLSSLVVTGFGVVLTQFFELRNERKADPPAVTITQPAPAPAQAGAPPKEVRHR